MANWLLVEDSGKKTGALINFDLVPHVQRQDDGSVVIHISATHSITVSPGAGTEASWDLIKRTLLKSGVHEQKV